MKHSKHMNSGESSSMILYWFDLLKPLLRIKSNHIFTLLTGNVSKINSVPRCYWKPGRVCLIYLEKPWQIDLPRTPSHTQWDLTLIILSTSDPINAFSVHVHVCVVCGDLSVRTLLGLYTNRNMIIMNNSTELLILFSEDTIAAIKPIIILLGFV